jgi:hypothetical protein
MMLITAFNPKNEQRVNLFFNTLKQAQQNNPSLKDFRVKGYYNETQQQQTTLNAF